MKVSRAISMTFFSQMTLAMIRSSFCRKLSMLLSQTQWSSPSSHLREVRFTLQMRHTGSSSANSTCDQAIQLLYFSTILTRLYSINLVTACATSPLQILCTGRHWSCCKPVIAQKSLGKRLCANAIVIAWLRRTWMSQHSAGLVWGKSGECWKHRSGLLWSLSYLVAEQCYHSSYQIWAWLQWLRVCSADTSPSHHTTAKHAAGWKL